MNRKSTPGLLQHTWIAFVACIILLVKPVSTYGQNILMSDGIDSWHAGAEFAYNTFETFYAIQPGYTFDDRLTLGFALGKNNDVVNKINSTLFRPSISYLLVKQSEESLPISIELNGAYQFDYVNQVMFNTQSILFGGGIYHEIDAVEGVKIIPGAIIGGRRAISGPNIRFRESAVLSYGLQASLLWNTYYLTPRLTVQDGVSTISATVGLIFL